MKNFFLLTFLFLAQASAWAVEVKLPVPAQETLANGLKVVWFLDEKLPVVDLGLFVRSGFRDDPAGKSGTAHLVSGLLQRGAAGKTSQQIAAELDFLGASRYVTLEEDSTTIGVHGLAPDAPTLLRTLSDMAVHPDFTAADVVRESARAIDQTNHLGDSADGLVSIAFYRAITGDSSYGRGSFLTIDEFKKITREDVLAFYKKNFTPKNSVLLVVGRVNQAEFREQIRKTFGDPAVWSGESPKRNYGKYNALKFKRSEVVGGDTVILVDRPGLNQAQVQLGMLAPSVHSPERYPLTVGNALLGEYFHSRLNTLIRDQLGLTYGIGSSISYNREQSVFAVSSATRNEAVGELLVKTKDVLKQFKAKAPSEFPNEVKMAKEYLVGGYPLSVSTIGAVALRWLAGDFFGFGPDFLNEFVPRVEKVTPDEVSRAMSSLMDFKQMVIVVAGDAKVLEKNLAASGFKVKRISAKDLK